MSIENEIFANRIKELRKACGLTQQQMADMVSLRKTAISNYETGYTTPSISTLKRFMEVFNKPASYFIPDCYEGREAKRKITGIMYGTAIHYYEPDNIRGLRSSEPTLMDSTLTLPAQQHLSKTGYIATSINDNSMNLSGIKKGSCIIINTQKKLPSDGEIFAAIRNNVLIVRKYHNNDRGTYMSAESTRIPAGLSIENIPQEDFEILGIVDKMITSL